MKIEYFVMTKAQKRERISEDCHVVAQIDGMPFFAAVVDGHGAEHLHDRTACFAACVAGHLAHQFVVTPKDEKAFLKIFGNVHDHVSHEFGTIQIGAVAACVAIQSTQIAIAHAICSLYGRRNPDRTQNVSFTQKTRHLRTDYRSSIAWRDCKAQNLGSSGR